MSDFDTDQMLNMSQYNLFPNITVLVFSDMVNVIRSRPGDDHETAFMDAFLFERRRARREPPQAKPLDLVLGPDDELPLGLVLGQDVANFERAHRGMRQPGTDAPDRVAHRGVPAGEPAPQPRTVSRDRPHRARGRGTTAGNSDVPLGRSAHSFKRCGLRVESMDVFDGLWARSTRRLPAARRTHFGDCWKSRFGAARNGPIASG